MAGLKELTQSFVESHNATDQLFGFNLSTSINAFHALSTPNIPNSIEYQIEEVEAYKLQCKTHVERFFDEILRFIRKRAPSLYRLQENSGLSPRFTPTSLLRLIATASPFHVSDPWKRIIIEYGISLTILQRAARLERLARMNGV